MRQLHSVLKGVYSFKNDQATLPKTSETRWIAHIMHSMAAFIDKFGVYLQHLVNVVTETSKQTNHAKEEGKRRKIILK